MNQIESDRISIRASCVPHLESAKHDERTRANDHWVLPILGLQNVYPELKFSEVPEIPYQDTSATHEEVATDAVRRWQPT